MSALQVYSRDCMPTLTFVKGDPYIRDLSNTKGHIGGVEDAEWHPVNPQLVVTCGLDGAVRVWDLQGTMALDELVNIGVLKLQQQTRRRIGTTACRCTVDGTQVVAGNVEGMISMWDLRKFGRPTMSQPLHDSEVAAISMSPDGRRMVTRADTGLFKLWDMRMMKTAAAEVTDVPSRQHLRNVVFSPDGSWLVCTGCGVVQGSS